MFCSECGVEASGKFCFHCGHPLQRGVDDQRGVGKRAGERFETIDWEFDPRYEVVLSVDSVREVISQHAAGAKRGMSGEALLAIADKIVASPVSFEGIAAVMQPIYASWGVRTGKERTERIAAPIGRTIARALCSLSGQSQAVEGVEQADTGCVLTAELPSNVWSFKGELKISLLADGDATQVAAATNIPGQLYDWGKSERCLAQLLGDLRSEMGLPPAAGRRVA